MSRFRHEGDSKTLLQHRLMTYFLCHPIGQGKISGEAKKKHAHAYADYLKSSSTKLTENAKDTRWLAGADAHSKASQHHEQEVHRPLHRHDHISQTLNWYHFHTCIHMHTRQHRIVLFFKYMDNNHKKANNRTYDWPTRSLHDIRLLVLAKKLFRNHFLLKKYTLVHNFTQKKYSTENAGKIGVTHHKGEKLTDNAFFTGLY